MTTTTRPKGVQIDADGKYRAVIQVAHRQVFLGRFDTIEAASAEWHRAKEIMDDHKAAGLPLPLWKLKHKPNRSKLGDVPDLLSRDGIEAERRRNRESKQAARLRRWAMSHPEQARKVMEALCSQ